MISIRFSDIPEQYHQSDLYRELLQNQCDENEEEEEIQIPARCFKPDNECESLEDLRGILQTSGYWGWKSLPYILYKFCSQHDVEYWRQIILDERNDQHILLFLFSRDDNLHPLERIMRYCELETETEIRHLIKIYLPEKTSVMNACSSAVRYGRRETLELLHENGYPWDDSLVDKASALGRLSCLIYLAQQGFGLMTKHTTTAAAYGKLDCLKYLHENNCPWDASATDGAAACGHHECLSYLCANNCPVNIEITITAARNGSVECMKVLLEERQLAMPTNGTLMVMAVVNAKLSMVKYLLSCNTSLVNCIFAENQLLDHYRSLDSTQYPLTAIAEHDENFMKCIVLAVQQGWVCNIELIRMVDHCRSNFPLTATYMLQQGWIRAAVS